MPPHARAVSGPLRLTSWSWPRVIQSVQELSALRPRVLAPGHGDPQTTGTAAAVEDLAERLAHPRRLLPQGLFRAVEYTGAGRYRRPPTAYLRLQWVVPLATALGLAPAYVVNLEVPGRRTGLVHRTTLGQTTLDGHHYLVALAGELEWVRNARAAGGCAVIGRRRRRAVSLVEVPRTNGRLPHRRERQHPLARGRAGVRAMLPVGTLAPVTAQASRARSREGPWCPGEENVMADLHTPALHRFARVAAVGTVATVVVSAAVGVTTPPRSGAYCQADCVTHPYTAVARFVPRDYWWMYPLLLMLPATLMLSVAIHGLTVRGRRALSLMGVGLTVVAVALLAADYGIQLTAVQPALLAGETDDLSLWTQYNPHGMFIALENVGYTAMGAGFVFLGSALAAQETRMERAAGWALRAGGALTLLALVAYAVVYGADLQYRFEVAAIAITWLTLLAAGASLALALGRHPRLHADAESTPAVRTGA